MTFNPFQLMKILGTSAETEDKLPFKPRAQIGKLVECGRSIDKFEKWNKFLKENGDAVIPFEEYIKKFKELYPDCA